MTDLEKIGQLQKKVWGYQKAIERIRTTMNNLQKDPHYSYVSEGLSIALGIMEGAEND